MSVNGLPVTQVQMEVTITKTVVLAEHQNKRLSQHHLQQQQKTANERSPDGTNRIETHGVPLKPQPDRMVFITPLQHFNTVQCEHLARLRRLFSDINPAILRNLLELCQGDFIRAVDNVIYIQACQQKHNGLTPQAVPFIMPASQAGWVSSGQPLADGNISQGDGRARALPNIWLSQKLNPRLPHQISNTAQKLQQFISVPVQLPSFEQSYRPQLLPRAPAVAHLKPGFYFISRHQGPNLQQPADQNIEGTKATRNFAECNKPPGSIVANLPEPPLIDCCSLQEDKENKPVKLENNRKVTSPKQCVKNVKHVQTHEIPDTSVFYCAPQKRLPFMIQDEANDACRDEKKKMKILEYLPEGSAEPKSLTLPDSSQGECPQMIADTRPLSEVLQPVMTCNSEHATGIPDLYTAQPCNAQKIQLPGPRNVIL